ncbi:uncharacterized protein EDB91DRAFT_1339135, partial [Suillus paluster]|uniref:uncharacterized protein n=1 Tax=Suillus paluster TaxID=48578 RepID=UPI001B8733B7
MLGYGPYLPISLPEQYYQLVFFSGLSTLSATLVHTLRPLEHLSQAAFDKSPLGIPRTFMASYSPLRMHDLEHQPEDESEDAILLPSKQFISEHRTADSPSEWPTWTALGLSVLAIVCACTVYIASASVSWPRDAYELRQPNQFPGLEYIDEPRQQQK